MALTSRFPDATASKTSDVKRTVERIVPNIDYEFFISTGQVEQVAKDARKTLRSHVMRNYIQQKNANPSALDAPSAAISSETAKSKSSLKGRFRLAPVASQAGRGAPNSQKEYQTALNKQSARKGRSPESANAGDSAGAPASAPQPGDVVSFSRASAKTTFDIAQETITLRPLSADLLVNPFDTLPVPNNIRVERLIYFYRTAFKINSVAVNPTSSWWGYTMHDRGLLHATLCSVAAYVNLTYGFKTSLDIVYHKGEALKAITSRINNESTLRKDPRSWEMLVATMATVASFENLTGMYNVAQTHLKALHRFVNERGGISSLASNDTLQRAVTWAEYHSAAAWRRKPLFQYMPPPSNEGFPDELLEQAALTSPTSLLNLSKYGCEVYNIVRKLHQLSLAASPGFLVNAHRVVISNQLYQTEYEILSFLALPSSESKPEVESEVLSIAQCIIFASQIFSFCAIRVVPLELRIYDIFLNRLKTTLEATEANSWEHQGLGDARLWTVFMGLVAAQTRKEFLDWFVIQMTMMLKEKTLEKEALEQILRRFAWLGSLCREPLNRFWDEFVILDGSLEESLHIDPQLLA